MRRACLVLLLLFFASPFVAGDDDQVVRWKTLIGVITAPGVSNPVAGIASGGLPWTTTGGSARVNLATGAIEWRVEGLVLNGGNNTGTPGAITEVKGTLICNPGNAPESANPQAVLDTGTVPLSPQGDATFRGDLGTVPSVCENPLFLVRSTSGRWFATGAVRVFGGKGND